MLSTDKPLRLLDACAKHSQAKGGAYELMRELCHYADNEHRTCYPSQQTLARRMRRSERWVRTLTARLIALGELVAYPRMMYHRTALLFIPPYPDEPGYNPQPCTKRGPGHLCSGHHTANPEEGRPPTRKPKVERKRRRGRPKPATQSLLTVDTAPAVPKRPAPVPEPVSTVPETPARVPPEPPATHGPAFFAELHRRAGWRDGHASERRARNEKALEGPHRYWLEPPEGGQP